jgi:hypothetical protein
MNSENTVSTPASVRAVESNQLRNERRRQRRADLRLNNTDEASARLARDITAQAIRRADLRLDNPDEAAARLARETAAQAVRRADLRSSTSEQICQKNGDYFGEICTISN